MAKLAYLLTPVEIDRALFLDTLECLYDDGALSRAQVRTLSMLSAHRLHCELSLQQRTPKGPVLATFGAEAFRVGRAGSAHMVA